MSLGVLIAILSLIAVASFVAIFVILGQNKKSAPKEKKKTAQETVSEKAEQDIEHIFNDEFREELRNRGRLHFEKIIGENAMFLQQDLRLTTSQLNEYMKAEITKKLQQEFAKYQESIVDAKQLAVDSINKTQEAIEQQRMVMSQQLQKELSEEKARILNHFSENMTEIVNHYVLAAIGNQIDLNDQLEYILGDLEANKKAIIEDISDGA